MVPACDCSVYLFVLNLVVVNGNLLYLVVVLFVKLQVYLVVTAGYTLVSDCRVYHVVEPVCDCRVNLFVLNLVLMMLLNRNLLCLVVVPVCDCRCTLL